MQSADSRLRDGLALVFASFFPVIMAYIYFVLLDDPDGKVNPALLAAFAIGKAVQFLFPAAYVLWFERDQIGMPRPTLRGMPFALGFALVVGMSMFLLYYFLVQYIPAVATQTPEKIYHRLQQFGRDSTSGYLMMAIYICVLHSLWEEYYWRWFVFGWMRRHMSAGLAILLSSIGFMLHHVVILGVYFPGNFWTLAFPFSIGVAVGGGVWAEIYRRSGSLYAPWLSHALIDAAIMGLGYWMLARYWT